MPHPARAAAQNNETPAGDPCQFSAAAQPPSSNWARRAGDDPPAGAA